MDGQFKILIVENNETERTRLETQIVEMGYFPLMAPGAGDALEMVRANRPHLLLYGMPAPGCGPDGLLGQLQEENLLSNLPVIVLYSHQDASLLCRCLELGAEDVLIRPVSQKILNTRISKCLTRQLEQEQLQQRVAGLEQIYELIPQTIFALLDPEHRVRQINAQARQLLGLPAEAVLEGMPIGDLLKPKSENLSATIVEMLRETRPVSHAYIEGAARNDQSRVYMVSLTPSRGRHKGGKPQTQNWIVMIRDLGPIRTGRLAKSGTENFHGIVGRDPSVLDICNLIQRVAPLPTSVLITGSTGVGKELVARAIHEESDRKHKPFIAVNCTALSKEILESELFGHVRGAFTGAIAGRKGRFREASGGTLLLDEIGDTTESFQTKLLRVLESGLIYPVGADQPVAVDVRIICATNRDLAMQIKKGRFREDLFYRINVVSINIPPLVERPGDLPLLIESFCREFNKRFNKSIRSISQDALRILVEYNWPGNIRELRHILERAFVVAEGETITTADLPSTLLPFPHKFMEKQSEAAAESGGVQIEPAIDADKLMSEPQRIQYALAKTGGNLSKAARILGIHRTTLWRKMKENEPTTGVG